MGSALVDVVKDDHTVYCPFISEQLPDTAFEFFSTGTSIPTIAIADEQAAQAEQEEASRAQSERMAELGRKGAQVKAERKQEEEAAYSEGMQAVKAAGDNIEALKEGVRGVIMRHPTVPEDIVKRVIRDSGYGKYESIVLPMVAELARAVLAPKKTGAAAPAGNFGGKVVWPEA